MSGAGVVSDTEVVMYSTGWCGYCERTRALLNRLGLAFREIGIEDPVMRAEMIARSGQRSVPQIFIGSRHVGGFDELYALERAGDLEPLLKREKP